jgi:hypothetical protein
MSWEGDDRKREDEKMEGQNNCMKEGIFHYILRNISEPSHQYNIACISLNICP